MVLGAQLCSILSRQRENLIRSLLENECAQSLQALGRLLDLLRPPAIPLSHNSALDETTLLLRLLLLMKLNLPLLECHNLCTLLGLVTSELAFMADEVHEQRLFGHLACLPPFLALGTRMFARQFLGHVHFHEKSVVVLGLAGP
jgi:hypothetical protein